jgi:NAD(P)-dependent dehydrogenase (short-subunit alcohol dehydrogenase family)
MKQILQNKFDLKGKVTVITGGAGLLGVKHAEAIIYGGGIPILVDIEEAKPLEKAQALSQEHGTEVFGIITNITKTNEVTEMLSWILRTLGHVDILINNAANNPKMETSSGQAWSRLENFPLSIWEQDISVGLTGAFLCSKIIGTELARQKQGVILNVASDLGIIAPDQRIYRKENLPDNEQPVKPVTYSVVKSGLIGLTRYLATYWALDGVRVNSIAPGGVVNGQPEDFIKRLTNLIPLGRMAGSDEYQAAVLFLCSDASSYMTGANLTIDGGRTCW